MGLFYMHVSLYVLCVFWRLLKACFTLLKNYYHRRKIIKNGQISLSEELQAKYAQDIWGNPEIFDNILLHLSTPDLLQCSLVCEPWRKRCRKFLRDKKHCKIILKFNICRQLKSLNNLLEHSTDLPFIGLHFRPSSHYFEHTKLHRKIVEYGYERFIKLGWRILGRISRRPGWPGCCEIKDEDLTARYPFLFQKLPVQYLFIDYSHQLTCLADNFLRTLLLKRASQSMEYLEILTWPQEIPSFGKYLKIRQSRKSPDSLKPNNFLRSLKIFNFNCANLPDNMSSDFVGEVVSSAQGLKFIWGNIPSGMLMAGNGFIGPFPLPQIPPTKHAAIRNFCFGYDLEVYNLARIQESRLGILGLKPTVLVPHVPFKDFQARVLQSLRTLVEANRTTLRKIIAIDSSHVLSATLNKNMRPLSQVREFSLHYSSSYRNFDDIRLSLRRIDFQSCLPNLSCVVLVLREGDWIKSGFLKNSLQLDSTSLTAAPAEAATFKCYTVTQLRIQCQDESSKTFYKMQGIQIWHDLADVFPSVKSIFVPDDAETVDFWEQITSPWRDTLDSVTCTFNDAANGFQDLWVYVLQLMEKFCCDINLEEMRLIDRRKIGEYSYAATRTPFCSETGILHINLNLTHRHACLLSLLSSDEGDWNDRFDILSSWMAAKLPNFSINIEYTPCLRKACNPLRLPVGTHSTRKFGKEEVRTIELKDWSKMDRRKFYFKWVEMYHKFYQRKMSQLSRSLHIGNNLGTFRGSMMLFVKLLALLEFVVYGSSLIGDYLPTSMYCQEIYTWVLYILSKTPYLNALVSEILYNERMARGNIYIPVIFIGVMILVTWSVIISPISLLIAYIVYTILSPIISFFRMHYDNYAGARDLLLLMQTLP